MLMGTNTLRMLADTETMTLYEKQHIPRTLMGSPLDTITLGKWTDFCIHAQMACELIQMQMPTRSRIKRYLLQANISSDAKIIFTNWLRTFVCGINHIQGGTSCSTEWEAWERHKFV
jgi:hypothetical protein